MGWQSLSIDFGPTLYIIDERDSALIGGTSKPQGEGVGLGSVLCL